MFANVEVCEFDKTTRLSLEPRLREYIKKKKYYRENNIDDQFIERDFSISKADIATIKKYMSSKNNKHTPESYHTDYVEQSKTFPSEHFKKDKRMEMIKKKQKTIADASEQRKNYDFIHNKYDMYNGHSSFSSATNTDFKTDFNPQSWFENTRNISPDDYQQHVNTVDPINPNIAQVTDMRKRYSNTNVYKNNPPEIRYNDYMTFGNNEDLKTSKNTLDEIIGNLNSYGNQHSDLADFNRRNKNTRKLSPEIQYNAVPYKKCAKKVDPNISNYLQYGADQLRTKKSDGYPNPFEHQYNYVSSDIQNPNHVVFERPMPSRLANKDTAKNHSYKQNEDYYKGREVML